MNIFEAIICVCDEVDLNGNMITKEQGEEMVRQINKQSMLVTVGFNMTRIAGKTVCAWMENNKVMAQIQLVDQYVSLAEDLYAGPGYQRHPFKVHTISLVLTHSDKEATKLRRV